VFAGHDPDTARAITGFDGHKPLVDAIEVRDADEAVRRNNDLLDRVAATLVGRLSIRLTPVATAGTQST
jgi:hypothetical protein